MFNRIFLSEKNMMAAIVINAIIIFLLYFPELKTNQFLMAFDHLFIIVFLIEAIVKLRILKPKKYFADKWNKFDFLIVVFSLPSLLYGIFPDMDTSSILLLRLLRLSRLLRFMRFVPHLTMIMDGLARAMKASVFVILVLFALNFILALFSCHFFGHITPEFFGNPLTSSYSIFQMFTLEGWNEIPKVIGEKMENDFLIGAMKLFFVLVVLIGGIFGMSLANAIFVDEMTMDNNNALEAKIDILQKELIEIKKLLKEK